MPPVRYPSEHIGDDAYLDELTRRLEAGRFPDPDASLIPEVTRARFVAAGAREANEHAFAAQVDDRRNPVFAPLTRFEAIVTLMDDRRRDQLGEEEFNDLMSDVELPETVSFGDDPAVILTETLTKREMTFFDYPSPPLHVIERAASEGREMIDPSSNERAESVPDRHRTYVQQRATIEAIVIGGRNVATGAYEEVIDRIHRESPSDRRYEDEDDYAEVVSFNAALAAESMLEDDGEIVTPP
jgi:hypothetical protein